MARDYRPRTAQTAPRPKPMLESHSQRQQRHQQQASGRNAWLVMGLVISTMVGGYWVIDHFASSGLRSGAQAELQATPTIQVLEEPAAAVSEARSVVEKAQTKVQPNPNLNPKPEAERIRAPLTQAELKAGDAESASAVQILPERTPIESVAEPISSVELKVQALPVQAERVIYGEPKKSFYTELKTQEVIPDDTTPEPVALQKPKYIRAGSFFSEQAALSAQQRFAKQGQKVKVRRSVRTDGRVVFSLYTEPYTNRLELNKRKNELRKLGASVMELDYKSSSSE
ncbi:MAG: SPOR domain-containing protein [Thiotrichales bacterium]|nr:SPOR domain-containing protein [Thiotrichales bacterium]